MSIILVFDDDASQRDEVVEAIQAQGGDTGSVMPFEGKEPPSDGLSYETHIGKWIESQCDGNQVGLIVCDKELGRYRNLRGLSATPVSEVALQKGIPFCQYSRQASEGGREFARFKRLRQWSSEQITLDRQEVAEWARQAKCLYDGFECIRHKYEELDKEGTTPAGTLAQILQHPESESRIALYGSGDQGFLGEILTYYDPEDAGADMAALYARMPRVLGTWLFLSILRFPGILVNSAAAESYLNIAHDDFGKAQVQELFSSAKYTGPFGDHELGPWWWRDEIDGIVFEGGCEDGRAYAEWKEMHVAECLDPDSNTRAGYYCMMTQQPVAAENSRGGINWFPSGADLARIRKDKFDQITALIGMY